MAIEIIHTPGAADANSFASREEINAILAERLPLDPPWETTGDAAAARIIMAQRIITSYFSGRRKFVNGCKGEYESYYVISPEWTGEIATPAQSLPWPRTGMVDRYGREIPDDEIPTDLKVAQAELAGLLGSGDRTLENDIAVQGITSIKAGPVAITFKDDIQSVVLPSSVFDLLVPSWYTDERVEYLTSGRRARLWNL